MSSPTPVREKHWSRYFFWPGLIYLGVPALGLWALIHMAAIDFACDCLGYAPNKWAVPLRVFGAIVIGVPTLFADWFVFWKYREIRRKKKWEEQYTAANLPWYATTGDERPKGPIKNKYYEP